MPGLETEQQQHVMTPAALRGAAETQLCWEDSELGQGLCIGQPEGGARE